MSSLSSNTSFLRQFGRRQYSSSSESETEDIGGIFVGEEEAAGLELVAADGEDDAGSSPDAGNNEEAGGEAGTGAAAAGGVEGATGVCDAAKGLAGTSARFTAEDVVGKESIT